MSQYSQSQTEHTHPSEKTKNKTEVTLPTLLGNHLKTMYITKNSPRGPQFGGHIL